MKVVLLAGGAGTRITEESEFRPKPLVEIGGMPVLWHIMKGYSYFGFNEFIVCAGYKQEMIKQWFSDYFLNTSDVTFDLTSPGNVTVHHQHSEPWRVTVVDTGERTMTGGRIKRIREYIASSDDPDTFMVTYGDGVCDVDIRELLRFHKSHGKIATLTAVRMGQDKGALDIAENNSVKSFREKAVSDGRFINAGFMVFNKQIFGYLENDDTILERAPLEHLAALGELMSYQHEGFWQCMDTIREKNLLEEIWASGKAPWKRWE